MAYQILVSDNSGIDKGEIVDVLSINHEFSPIETMQEHIKAGGTMETWSRVFSLVIGTDKSQEEMEYLKEYLPDGITKKHFFIVPTTGTPEFIELYNTGQISRDTETILKFIGTR
ncbi:MAG: hypothetical protein HRU18_00715 [Pseudoalteromonas sp.]|uniref:hypothetical protein n=1 Tax=Pseudoalteromonas sp. TaxID=53249 RepID=UPI001D378522|nr:hypothetical protein [Pseudoalteromonas sp.]NRA76701.1 hypothetical protein [Pseudoalteromonas sp.]